MGETNAEILSHVQDFMSGKIGVIEVSRKLWGYWNEVHKSNPELAKELATFVLINDATEALPMGALREMWHPSTAHLEDEKIRQAEEKYRDVVQKTCRNILNLLM